MSQENNNSQQLRSPTKVPECMEKAQQFFAEGNLVPDNDDPNKFQINGDMLLPEHRNLRVRFELRANIQDLIKMETVEKLSRSVKTADLSPTKSSPTKSPQSSNSSPKSRSKRTNQSQSSDRRYETESPPERVRVKSVTGQRTMTPDDRPVDRRVSWGKPTTIRRRLQFSSSSSASPSPNDQSSELQQSTGTPTNDQRPSVLSQSPSTLGSVPTANEPTLPEPSVTAQSLEEGDDNLSESNLESERGTRLKSAIKSGRVTVNRRGREKQSTPKKKRTTITQKAGLIFPPLKIGRELKDKTGKRVFRKTMVHLAAIVETVTADLLEISGEATQEGKRKIIQPRDIKNAVTNDSEFEELFRNVHVPLDPPNCN